MSPPFRVRPGRDEDAPGIIALVSACWAEYPGCVMALQDENPDLLALASHFEAAGGALWVAEAQDGVVGMIGARPHLGTTWELCRLYVDAGVRGSGLAASLVDELEAHVRAAGGTAVELWSDTRFARAHRFYQRMGYAIGAAPRPLFDLSNSWEFHGRKAL